MLRNKKNLRLLFSSITLISYIIFLSGCAAINFKNKHDNLAYDFATEIRKTNSEIKSSKGLGWLKIKARNSENSDTHFKIAWVAEPPDKIRITILSSGFPLETVVYNGAKISIFSHTGKHSLKTYNVKNPSLKEILSIPVNIHDIILLLSGKIPIRDFQYAFFENTIKPAIVLKNKLGSGIQKFNVNSKNQITRYISADWEFKPIFEIVFSDYMTIDSAVIPFKMLIKDNLDREVTLEIFKFYINQPVKNSLFTLTEQR